MLEYLISAGGHKIHDTTLRDETLIFLKRLTVAAGNAPKTALVYSLPASNPPALGIRCADVLSGFYSFLGFARLTSDLVVRRAILRGITDGVFGYVNVVAPPLGPDGKFQVPLAKVRFEHLIPEDEIDFDSGFLMLPQAIPHPAVPPAPIPDQLVGAPQLIELPPPWRRLPSANPGAPLPIKNSSTCRSRPTATRFSKSGMPLPTWPSWPAK